MTEDGGSEEQSILTQLRPFAETVTDHVSSVRYLQSSLYYKITGVPTRFDTKPKVPRNGTPGTTEKLE